jgi:hypothetical protein
MRKQLLVAGIAAAVLIPSFAMAQTTCEQRSTNRTVGTVGGAVVGALLGSAIAGHGHKGDGAIVGGVGGAVVGNQISKGEKDCQHAYGYYDSNSQWHASGVSREAASGYYDREGRWVDGAPNGHYASDGRWQAGPSAGYAAGYYDNNNRWVASAPSANGYGRSASYETQGYGQNMPRDIPTRLSFIDQRIRDGVDNGSISRREAHNDIRELRAIRSQAANMSHRDGRLSARNESYIQAKLDNLSHRVGSDRQN